MGVLFVVATPIGNLQDMTPRAVEVLREVSLIAAEDTRHSARLLRHFGIATPVTSHHQHNERGTVERLLAALASSDVALITDAGTPAVSDPGAHLVRAVLRAGHRVVPVPGPSAVIAAVSASGLVDGPFLFLGFVARSGAERRAALARVATSDVPVVLFESPNRVAATLADLAALAPDRNSVVARELTKIHEEIRSGTLAMLAEGFASEERVRGEIVIVVGAGEAVSFAPDADGARSMAAALLADGTKPSTAAREIARVFGMAGEEAYALVRSLRGATESG